MLKFILRFIFLVGIAAIMQGCASGYKQFYTQIEEPREVENFRAAPPTGQPFIERSRPGNPDEILDVYARRGYVMIGNSMFNSGRPESENSAVQQAIDVYADLVLILSPNYTGSVTSSLRITTPTTSTSRTTATATAYGRGGPVTASGTATTTTYGTSTSYVPVIVHRSDYGAVYFVKQRFSFGAHFRNLNETERQQYQTNHGVVVQMVVENTPAFIADFLVGDILVSLDGTPISGLETIGQFLSERKGRLVQLQAIRNGQRFEKAVQLNP